MDLELERRAQKVFFDLLEFEGDELKREFDERTKDDLLLRSAVRELLDADANGEHALDTASFGAPRAMLDILSDTVPERLGRYRVVREVGRGAMGAVYEAQQETPRRRVALKTVHPWIDANAAKHWFENEVQALANVIHPGIPQLYEVFEVHGTPVLAMEFVPGRPLREAAAGTTVHARVRWLIQIAEALHHAHDANVIHRDLKPSNVRVTPLNHAKLLDFGVAIADGRDPGVGGTPVYMAPEVLAQRSADRRADVYGIGATAWELLSGNAPFDAQRLANVLADKRRGPPHDPRIPRPLEAVLRKCMAADPRQRYATAGDVADEFRRYLEHVPVRALEPSRWDHIRSFARRNRGALGVGLAAAAGLLGIAALSAQAVDIWRQNRIEARAQSALATLMADAPRQSDERVRASFEGLVNNSDFEGTEAASRAWRWWAERVTGDERLDALIAAWVRAPSEATARSSIHGLLQELAWDAEWPVVGALLDELPNDNEMGPLRVDEAMARWDLPQAARYADPELLPLLDILTMARQEPFDIRAGNISAEGARFGISGDQIVRIERGEAKPQLSVDRLKPKLVTGSDGRWGITQQGDRVLVPWVGPVQIFDDPDSRWHDLALGDLDNDGVEELYAGGTLTLDAWRVAEPATGELRPINHPLNLGPTISGGIAIGDIDNDGVDELAIAVRSWAAKGVFIFEEVNDELVEIGWIQVYPDGLTFVKDDQDRDQLVVAGRAWTDYPVMGPNRPASENRIITFAWDEGPRVLSSQQIPFTPSFLRAANLDGDGRTDLLIGNHGKSSALARRVPNGRWAILPTHELQFIASGDLDRDGIDEVWAYDEDNNSLLFGFGGDPPRKRQSFAAAPSTRPAPEDATEMEQLRWNRAERLASVGLDNVAAKQFVSLGRQPGPLRVPAYFRAIEIANTTNDPEAAADLGEAIVRPALELLQTREATDAQRQVAVAFLRRHHAFEQQHAIDDPSLAASWEQDRAALLQEGTLSDDVHFYSPLAAHWSPMRGELDIESMHPFDTVAEVPLLWNGELLEINMEMDVTEHDFAVSIGFALEFSDTQAEFRYGAGGGGPRENLHNSFWCGHKREAQQRLPYLEGPRSVRVSWTRGTGIIRCEVDGLVSEQQVDLPPEPEFTLRLVGTDERFGLFAGSIRHLTVRGARAEARELSQVDLMVRGDFQAARDIRNRGSDPFIRGYAAHLLGEASPPELAQLSDEEWERLLRTDPAAWHLAARQYLGDRYDDVLAKTWEALVRRPAERHERLFSSPVFSGLGFETPGLAKVQGVRLARLYREGNLVAAEALRRRIASSSFPDWAFFQEARLFALDGQKERAKALINIWVQHSQNSAVARNIIHETPELRRLSPWAEAPEPVPRPSGIE